MKMKYCDNCKQNVKPYQEFGWCLFFILLCIFVIPGIIYLVYPKAYHCPICKGIIPKNNFFKTTQPIEPPQQLIPPVIHQQIPIPQEQTTTVKLKVCSYCGDRIKEESEYCDYCGAKQ